ncbi:MAG: 1-aminocyclopropane-1-carboxylate deaminase [Aliarcobacter sp.]|jgi:1-aminocyclopropane-1-carboxylate deaminase/D-cysteine desulfhydrase-like pyridoxal-dependent ACC family enzyme|nr:1-aminocyclopropane-1-carboxylate deaminase [Aliarcobacter sp.]
MNYTNSPIEQITFNSKKYFIKRDDLLHKDFSGNKARKFYYFLKNDFPNIKKVVSHGSAQSNAMYSLSVLCKIKGLAFDYYVDHIASFLKENPSGNYKYALENKMNIIESEVPNTFKDDTLFISEGGAVSEACFGIKILASEIISWAKENKIEKLKVFLPSGTGTTALYLQKYLSFEVLTCACVGDDDYLKKQFDMLEKENHPTIIKRERKYHFGKLYKEFYEIHNELLQQTNIEFDFLYDSLGWICLENYIKDFEKKDFEILYIHQGGILGNISMIERYKNKYDSI